MSKIYDKTMYPELEKVGGLSNALNLEFEKIDSGLCVAVDDLNKIPLAYARVVNGSKFSQIYIAAEEKGYLPDFWRDGVCLADARTDNISYLAKVIDFWLSQDVTTKGLAEKFRFVQPSKKAAAFDEGKEVEYTWSCLLRDNSLRLDGFVKRASKDEILSKLFPFISLDALCFSRCTGYPYDIDNLPSITSRQFESAADRKYDERDVREGNHHTFKFFYIVKGSQREYLGEGNAEEALKIVKAYLPDYIGPAVKGTAND